MFMRRILHAVLSRQFYGSERHCIELATEQARLGHTVFVLVEDSGSYCAAEFRKYISETRRNTIRLIAIPGWLPGFCYRPLAWLLLLVLRPDIVHTHLNSATRRIGSAAHALGIPHVTTLHIRYDHREHQRCDGLICGASWQRRAIRSDFAGHVATIWAWLPAAIQRALVRVTDEDVSDCRARWGADDRTIVFGSIGRLSPEKGMDLLVQAFQKAFPHGTESVRLVIVGVGAGEEDLRRATELDHRIKLVTSQGEVAPLYRAFDVYVSAARFEPFGLTIVEAMDAGCPLIITRTDGPSEFLKDERVLWANLNDAESLARQLSSARQRIRLRYDLKPFSPERAVREIESFYEDVSRRRYTAARPLPVPKVPDQEISQAL
jgi:glycosyltransferase involved in cell wall biosynthesis